MIRTQNNVQTVAITYRMSQKEMFTRLVGCGIKSLSPIFKTKMFICQSKANLDEKILFGNTGGGGNYHICRYGMCHFLGCLFSNRK